MRGRRHSPWPRVRAEKLTAALEAGGKHLDAGQRETVRLLTTRQSNGVYLHGGVGRGKTWISGQFFDAAEVPKARMHMHALLGQVNQLVAGAPAGQPDGTGPAVDGPASGVSVPVGASGTRRLRVTAADPAQGILTATFAQLCGQPGPGPAGP